MILRAAARSMVDEPDDYAPYGWSHCLTLPQGVLGSAGASSDPVAAVAIAATFVVGFRAAMSAAPLGDDVPVAPPAETVTELVTHAATHPDAHLVKYTLACLDAAAWDPDARRPLPVRGRAARPLLDAAPPTTLSPQRSRA